MNIKYYLLSFFALALIGFSTNVNAQGVSVDQGRLFFKNVPGESQTKEIVLTNPTKEKVILQMSFSDWSRDENGIKNYVEANTSGHSCASWVNLSSSSVEIPPMSEKTLRVEMTPPSDFKAKQGVQNTMLFISQIRDPLARTNTGGNLKSSIDVAFQIGVHVYYIHPSLQKKELAIKGFKIDTNNDASTAQLMLKLQNVGETVVDGSIKIELTHAETGKEFRLFEKHPISAAFMPNDVRSVPLELPAELPAGAYSALAIVDIGPAHDLQMAMIDIELPEKK